jgi:hypothetical protein
MAAVLNIDAPMALYLMLYFLIFHVAAWWRRRHEIIATIACRNLRPGQLQWLTDLFSLWPGESGTIVGLASWLDGLRGRGSRIIPMSNWHFCPTAFFPDRPFLVRPPVYNVTAALHDTINILLNTITTSPWAISFGLRLLVHLVGDAHQPMHAISRFDARRPKGDAGGNCYRLSGRGANLHRLWDGGWKANAAAIMKKNPSQALAHRVAIFDPAVWSDEAWTIGAEFAYGVAEGTAPSATYVKGLQSHSETQMAVASYRLGQILKAFFQVSRRIELPNITAGQG